MAGNHFNARRAHYAPIRNCLLNERDGFATQFKRRCRTTGQTLYLCSSCGDWFYREQTTAAKKNLGAAPIQCLTCEEEREGRIEGHARRIEAELAARGLTARGMKDENWDYEASGLIY